MDRSQKAHFCSPCDIDFDARGHIYVADSMNGRIQVFTPDELLSYTINGVQQSQGLYIYYYDDSILVTTSTGSMYVCSLSGEKYGSICHYCCTSDSAIVDADGFLYVTCPNHNLINVY